MQIQISIREANQHLSRYIESVEQGDDIVITKRGKPVARLSPIEDVKVLSSEQLEAVKRIKAKMNSGYHLGEKFSRDELHER